MHLNLYLVNAAAVTAVLLLASPASAKPMDFINVFLGPSTPQKFYEEYPIGKPGAFMNPRLRIIRKVFMSDKADFLHGKMDDTDVTITCVPREGIQTNTVAKFSEHFWQKPPPANTNKPEGEEYIAHTTEKAYSKNKVCYISRPACVTTYDEFLKKVSTQYSYSQQWILSITRRQLISAIRYFNSKGLAYYPGDTLCFDAEDNLALVRFDKLHVVSSVDAQVLRDVDTSTANIISDLCLRLSKVLYLGNPMNEAERMARSLRYAPPTYENSGVARPNYEHPSDFIFRSTSTDTLPIYEHTASSSN
ncbi:hypothetical protein BDF22DRAFT_701664 [Syncephalis plumigaleata]|nr:hypothetical protein BDF22DRAFT_701664 [Syncephalis plumigaleata]